MRVIKLGLISFIILFLLVTGISLFIPGDIRISKATNIASDDTAIYTYFEKLPGWRAWHPALKDIPENEFEVLADTSIKVRGTVINLTAKGQQEVITEIVSRNSRPIKSGIKIIRHHQADSATLQWYMDFKLKWYPWEKFKSLFYENFYGVQMEQGLSNLKELSEHRRSSIN